MKLVSFRFSEEMVEKSALSREIFQLKNSVRIYEAAYLQKMEAMETEVLHHHIVARILYFARNV